MPDTQFLSLVLIGLGLSADCFAIAISTSIANKNLPFFHVGRISLTFGTFHTLMPAIGWLVGISVVQFIGGFDHWVALALLGIIGGKMIWNAVRGRKKEDGGMDITNVKRIVPLLIIGVATSIDALAIGLSFAFMKANVLISCITVGVTVAIVAFTGFFVGRKAGSLVGNRAEIVGGLILVAIGVKVAVDHLT
jgi:putative Mn2+ efflux pump MntP